MEKLINFNLRNPVLIVATIGVLHLLLMWPGILQPDSSGQYAMAMAGVYTDHHPALMSFVWRLLSYVISSPAGSMFFLQLLLLYSAIYFLISSISKIPNINNKIKFLFLLLPLVPQVSRYGSMILKDVQFAFSFLLVAAYLAYLTINYANIKHKLKIYNYNIIAILIILLYGTGVKFQAQYCAPVFLLWLSFLIADQKLISKKFIKNFLGLIIIFYSLLNLVNFILVPNTQKDHSWQYVKFYDLAVISRTVKQDLFPDFVKKDNFSMKELTNRLDYCKSLFNCQYCSRSVDTFVFGSDAMLQKGINEQQRRIVYTAWLKAVIKHPLLYLEHRCTNMICTLVGIPFSFKQFTNNFIIKILVYLTISNLFFILLSFVYFIYGIFIYRKHKNLFAIPLIGFNAVGIIMVAVLFFCSMASVPRYVYVNVCLVHASHIFAYLAWRQTKYIKQNK